MKLNTNFATVARSLGVIAAIIALVGGVTYAALQSQQAKLTGNTIETATANLQISTDGNTFAYSLPGYNFNNLIPGGQPVPQYGKNVYLRNNGGAPLQLKLALASTPSNPDNVDLSKVNLVLTLRDNSNIQTISLNSLLEAANTGGVPLTAVTSLTPGYTAQYSLQVSMSSDAFSGTSASLGNIDLAFSGLALTN